MTTSKLEPSDVFWNIPVRWERLTCLILLLEVIKDRLRLATCTALGLLNHTLSQVLTGVLVSLSISRLSRTWGYTIDSWFVSHSPTFFTLGLKHVSQKQGWKKCVCLLLIKSDSVLLNGADVNGAKQGPSLVLFYYGRRRFNVVIIANLKSMNLG